MKIKALCFAWIFSAVFASAVPKESRGQELTGDVRLACEAILCLAAATVPSECMPSLNKYFSIVFTKFSDTIRGRLNFLNLCPVASQDDKMRSLVNAVANGAGRCDAASLNLNLRLTWGVDTGITISNVMPDYCTAYAQNPYTNLSGSLPKYVGTPDTGGLWVDPAQYAQALQDYNDRMARQAEEDRRNNLR